MKKNPNIFPVKPSERIKVKMKPEGILIQPAQTQAWSVNLKKLQTDHDNIQACYIFLPNKVLMLMKTPILSIFNLCHVK